MSAFPLYQEPDIWQGTAPLWWGLAAALLLATIIISVVVVMLDRRRQRRTGVYEPYTRATMIGSTASGIMLAIMFGAALIGSVNYGELKDAATRSHITAVHTWLNRSYGLDVSNSQVRSLLRGDTVVLRDDADIDSVYRISDPTSPAAVLLQTTDTPVTPEH